MTESMMTRGEERFICKNIETFRSFELAFLVPFFGAIAYWFVNFDALSLGQMCFVGGAVVFCGCAFVFCFVRYNHYMKKIRRLR